MAGKKEKAETARVRNLGPSKKTAKVGTSVPLKQTARERTRKLFREPVEWWRVQKKAKGRDVEEKEKKKKVKYRRRVWWRKCKERIVSLSTAKMKEEKKEKGRQKERETDVPE